MFVYELEIPEIGRLGNPILREETDRSMKGWHGIAVRKALRYKRVPEEIKEHLRNGNSIVGWANSDELRAQNSPEDFLILVRKAYKGMDKKNE